MEQTKIDEEIEREENFKIALIEEQLDREAEEKAEIAGCLNKLKYVLEDFYDEIYILLGNVEQIMDGFTEIDTCKEDEVEEMIHKIKDINRDISCLFDNIFDPTLGFK